MKKSLLILLGATVLAPMAYAGVETTEYPTVDGLTCQNIWQVSRALDNTEYATAPYAAYTNKARTMVIKDGRILLAESPTITEGDSSNNYGRIVIFDLATGKYEKTVQITVNGTPLTGLLCANQIGVDDFGNVWVTGVVGDASKRPFNIYRIKDLDTGEAELALSLSVPEDEEVMATRHDYYDLVGDITGKQAGTVFMTPAAPVSGATLKAYSYVFGFTREQGSEEWQPHMNDGIYYTSIYDDTYPEGQSTWDGAPMIRIVRNEEHSGDMFYIDAFTTHPTLYNNSGTLIESFRSCPELAPSTTNVNGVNEFAFGDDHYLTFTLDDASTLNSQIRVCKLGAGGTFEGSSLLWDLPKNGLGAVRDGGTRAFAQEVVVRADANGKYGCYLVIFKPNNGMAAYRIAQEGWIDTIGGIDDVAVDEDNNAPVEYYDLRGIRVNPDDAAAGLYIRRQGSTVSKVIIK